MLILFSFPSPLRSTSHPAQSFPPSSPALSLPYIRLSRYPQSTTRIRWYHNRRHDQLLPVLVDPTSFLLRQLEPFEVRLHAQGLRRSRYRNCHDRIDR